MYQTYWGFKILRWKKELSKWGLVPGHTKSSLQTLSAYLCIVTLMTFALNILLLRARLRCSLNIYQFYNNMCFSLSCRLQSTIKSDRRINSYHGIVSLTCVFRTVHLRTGQIHQLICTKKSCLKPCRLTPEIRTSIQCPFCSFGKD